jgi:hypothetical protein
MQHLLAARAFSETLNGGQPGLEGHDGLEAPEIEGEAEPEALVDLMQAAAE